VDVVLTQIFCRRELAKDVVELLTNAADGAKSLIDATDRLVLYVEIARLYASLGYERKAAFFSRQVAQLYLQQENRYAAISALQVLAISTKAYRVQSKASVARDSLPVSYNCQSERFGSLSYIWRLPCLVKVVTSDLMGHFTTCA